MSAEKSDAVEPSASVDNTTQGFPPPTSAKPVSDVQCSMCGRDGGPVPECDLCLGNQRFVQSRAFTLTEERQGLNTDEAARRYGRTGDVNPRIIQLPGGFVPGGTN